MQKTFKHLILATLAFCNPVVLADTLTIIADPWCPYNCKPNSDLPGYGIEIANYAFNKAGHSVVYKNVNWARAVQYVITGQYTGLISAYKADAPGFVFPDEPFGISSVGVFVKKESEWQYKGLGSLRNLGKVGTINGYVYSEEIMAFIAENPSMFEKMSGETALDNNIRKLIAGRINGVFEDPNVFMMEAKRLGVDKQVKLEGKANKGDYLYFAFSPNLPKSKEYAGILSTGIKELVKTGEINTIMGKYGLKYWK